MSIEVQELLQKQRSAALHDTLQQRDIRLIIFPDWQQSENLGQNLAPVISVSAMHPDKHRLILFVDTSNVTEVAAKQALAGVVSSVLPPEVLDDPHGPVLLPIGKLNEAQWQALLPHLTARIILEYENKEAIAAANADIVASLGTTATRGPREARYYASF